MAMRISSAFVSTYAEMVGGRVSIIGAFPAGLTISADLPSTQSLGFTCVCEIDPTEIGRTVTFDLLLSAPSGTKSQLWHFAGQIVAVPGLPRNAPMRETYICQVPVVFQMGGLHYFEFVGEGLSTAVPFYIECVR